MYFLCTFPLRIYFILIFERKEQTCGIIYRNLKRQDSI